MTDPTSPIQSHLPLSMSQVVERIQRLSDEGLRQWLAESLEGKPSRVAPLPTRWEAHTFIADIYRKCSPSLQVRLGYALAGLLESFVPNVSRSKNSKMAFQLLSLASTIRNERTKERLRRWLYSEIFKDWEYAIFNIHGELILATSTYDSDEVWMNYIRRILPTKEFFPQVARHAYRAVLQTRGISCLDMLPDILPVLDPETGNNKEAFGYLLGVTLDRFGKELFLKKATETLKTEWRVERIFINVSRLGQFLQSVLSGKQELFEEFHGHFDREIWRPCADKWRSLEREDNHLAFEAILDVCKPEPTPTYLITDALGVLRFPGPHELVVPESFTHLRPYFQGSELAIGMGA